MISRSPNLPEKRFDEQSAIISESILKKTRGDVMVQTPVQTLAVPILGRSVDQHQVFGDRTWSQFEHFLHGKFRRGTGPFRIP
jgi:hypothetical protein